MDIVIALIGVAIWGLMVVLSSSVRANVKLFGSYIYNPFIKMFLGPMILILGGAVLVIGGLIAISPFILVLNGYPGWGMIVLVVELLLSKFTNITYNDIDVSYSTPLWVRMALGLALLWIGGSIIIVLGAILASPVLLIALALL